MDPLRRLPRSDVLEFFAFLLVWPILAGDIGIIISRMIFPGGRPMDLFTYTFTLILELTVGVLPSTCLAILVGLLRASSLRRRTNVVSTIGVGGLLAGTMGQLPGRSFNDALLPAASGVLSAALCVALLNLHRSYYGDCKTPK